MAFVRLDDLSGSIEVIAFNSAYAAARELLEADRVLLVKGRVDHKDGEMKLVALEVTRSRPSRNAREVRLRVDARRAHAGVIRELAEVVRGFPGRPVSSPSTLPLGPRTLQLGPGLHRSARAGLLRRGEGAPRRGGRRGLAAAPSRWFGRSEPPPGARARPPTSSGSHHPPRALPLAARRARGSGSEDPGATAVGRPRAAPTEEGPGSSRPVASRRVVRGRLEPGCPRVPRLAWSVDRPPASGPPQTRGRPSFSGRG